MQGRPLSRNIESPVKVLRDSSEVFVINDPVELKDTFSRDVNNVKYLAERILSFVGIPGEEIDTETTAFYKALSRHFEDREQEVHCFSQTLASSAGSILGTKTSHRVEFPLEPKHWACSRSECRAILANAFLGNIRGDPVEPKKPGLNFRSMYTTSKEVASNKLRCLLQYLEASSFLTKAQENEKVVFERVSMSSTDFEQQILWNSTRILDSAVHAIVVNPMETRKAHAMVNFANEIYGTGRFGSTCTQEEILQMCCPEINIGMLLHQHMPPDTVVVAKNIQRYSSYSGYSTSFRFEGAFDSPRLLQNVIFMDASIAESEGQQFTLENNLRDIRKAYLGFSASAQSKDSHEKEALEDELHIVSTGKWGCGVFGGNPVLKFLQQLIAATLSQNVALLFSSYRNEQLKRTLQEIHRAALGLSPYVLLHFVLVRPDLFDESSHYQPLHAELKRLNDCKREMASRAEPNLSRR